MKATKKEALATRCPTCGAKPGEKCELGTGQPRTDPHRDRRLVALDNLSADMSPFLIASDNRCRLCHLPDIMIPVRLPNHWPFGDRAFRFLVGATGVQENDLTAVQY